MKPLYRQPPQGIILVIIVILLFCFTLLGAFIGMLLLHSIQSVTDHKDEVEQNLKRHQFLNTEVVRMQELLSNGAPNLLTHSIDQSTGCLNNLSPIFRLESGKEAFSTKIFEISDQCLLFKSDRRSYQLWVNSGDDSMIRASFTVNKPKYDHTLWLDAKKIGFLSLPKQINDDEKCLNEACNQLVVIFNQLKDGTDKAILKVDDALLRRHSNQINYFIAIIMEGYHRAYLLDRLGGLWMLDIYSDHTGAFKFLSQLNIDELSDPSFTLSAINSEHYGQYWNIRLSMISKKKDWVLYQGMLNLSNIPPHYSFSEIVFSNPQRHEVTDQSASARQVYQPIDFWKIAFKETQLIQIEEENGLLRLLTKNSYDQDWLWMIYRDGMPLFRRENIYGFSKAKGMQYARLEECTPELEEKIYFDHWLVGCVLPDLFNQERFY